MSLLDSTTIANIVYCFDINYNNILLVVKENSQ